MKLVRYGKAGKEKPGLVDKTGKLRDLSEVIVDIDADTLAPRALARLAKLKPDSLPPVRGAPRIGPCVAGVEQLHRGRAQLRRPRRRNRRQPPKEPVLFNKAPSCIVGPNDDVIVPKGSTKPDWEVELAVVIGTRASYVSEADALKYVAGYCICNDVSERAFQIERSGQWMKGKGCPTFGPLGPWLVTPDEIDDAQKLGLWLDVNGERMQNGSTSTMIFGVKTLVSYISQFMILEPGDVITTGTPAGRRPRQEAAGLPQGRRHDLARRRRARPAGAARGRLQDRVGGSRDEALVVNRPRPRGADRARVRRALPRVPEARGSLVRRPAARPRRPALHARHAGAERRELRLRRRHDRPRSRRCGVLLGARLCRGMVGRGGGARRDLGYAAAVGRAR